MIAAYKGISLKSRLIRFLNWSDYSHVSWVSAHGWEIEAWSSGVRKLAVAHSDHTPGTEVDLFAADLNPAEEVLLENWLHRQIGKRYDWLGVLRFLTRRDVPNPLTWFCSRLLFAAFLAIRRPLLLRIPAHKVYPGMMVYSPLLAHVRTIRVPDPKSKINHQPSTIPDMEFICAH